MLMVFAHMELYLLATVASQSEERPLSQGTKVRLSGHLPFDLDNPDGSKVEGKPAETRDL